VLTVDKSKLLQTLEGRLQGKTLVEITEVRIKLVSEVDTRLRAFCSITIDRGFVVRDLKIIQRQLDYFVAMPSRKLTEKCPRCTAKNDVRSRYCSNCGAALPPAPATDPTGSRNRMFVDIAHPVNAACRDQIETAVLAAFKEEKIRSEQPDYVCRYDDLDEA
jgi:stage V sporulation protein G